MNNDNAIYCARCTFDHSIQLLARERNVIMRPPEFITFTGLDARTDLLRASRLAERYPVEWGVLFSPKAQGIDPRYPDIDTVSSILETDLRLSAHLCGGYSRSIMAGEEPSLPVSLDRFGRAQVNNKHPDAGMIAEFSRRSGFRCIAQYREVEFPDDTRIDWLFDCSGGKGEAPDNWPEHPGGNRLVGYAGGIGPENVRDVLAAIDRSGPYWIDMESRIRTDNWLDLDKVEAVCKAVYG